MQAKGIDRSINGSFSPLRDCRPFSNSNLFFNNEGSERRSYLYKVIKLVNGGARTMFLYFQYLAFPP